MNEALILLTMALQLLLAVNAPNIPISLKQSAILVANNAIQVANRAMVEASKPAPVSVPIPVATPVPTPASPPIPQVTEHPFEIIPVKVENSIELSQSGYSISIPKIFLGTFRARTNSNTQIRWYDCNVTSANPNITFGSYKLERLIGGGNNNCFTNTSLLTTDKNGFTEEVSLYLNDLDITRLNKSNSVHNLRFYLNDITIREVTYGSFHQATSSLAFDLEILKY